LRCGRFKDQEAFKEKTKSKGVERIASIQYQVSSIQPRFPLTYKAVICKQHSALFPNQCSSFNPIKKEDLKWSMVTRKPRYPDQMESGVFYFVALVKIQSEKWGAGVKISQQDLRNYTKKDT